MKKLISLFLTVILALSLVPVAFAAEGASVDKFIDVPADAWYKEELAYAVYNGYISGTSATTFSPDGLVTRGQFVTILGRMLGVGEASWATWSKEFTDVPRTAYYALYVGWAADMGYVNGTSATTFAPDANITMEQIGTILANYINKSGVVPTGTVPQEQYADANTISGWAKDNMELMRQHDLLPVDGKGNVSPRKAATRAEATVTLVRLAKAAGWGTSPEPEQPQPVVVTKAQAKAQSIHDELWASGKITSSMTEKEKAIQYYMWMSQNCRYRDNPEDTLRYSAQGALVNGYAVCQGLSLGYKLLLETEGIKCGTFAASASHMLNSATLDGEEYEIDVTDGVSAWDIDGTYDAEWAQRACDSYFMDYDEWWAKWFNYDSFD